MWLMKKNQHLETALWAQLLTTKWFSKKVCFLFFFISKYKMCHYFVLCVKMLDQYLNN